MRKQEPDIYFWRILEQPTGKFSQLGIVDDGKVVADGPFPTQGQQFGRSWHAVVSKESQVFWFG